MSVHQEVLTVRTRGRGLIDVTREIGDIVARSSVSCGLCHIFLQHTSASLLIQENADPAVLRDLNRFFEELVPEQRAWEHDDEGPDDMPAHVKCALTKTQETLPVRDAQMALGTWQALYVWEHRARAHERTLVVTVYGEAR